MTTTNEITTEWSGTPLKKLEALLTDGWQVSGVSVVKTMPDGTVRRGAITTGGMGHVECVRCTRREAAPPDAVAMLARWEYSPPDELTD